VSWPLLASEKPQACLSMCECALNPIVSASYADSAGAVFAGTSMTLAPAKSPRLHDQLAHRIDRLGLGGHFGLS
jgi:hypothetical protein